MARTWTGTGGPGADEPVHERLLENEDRTREVGDSLREPVFQAAACGSRRVVSSVNLRDRGWEDKDDPIGVTTGRRRSIGDYAFVSHMVAIERVRKAVVLRSGRPRTSIERAIRQAAEDPWKRYSYSKYQDRGPWAPEHGAGPAARQTLGSRQGSLVKPRRPPLRNLPRTGRGAYRAYSSRPGLARLVTAEEIARHDFNEPYIRTAGSAPAGKLVAGTDDDAEIRAFENARACGRDGQDHRHARGWRERDKAPGTCTVYSPVPRKTSCSTQQPCSGWPAGCRPASCSK